MKCDQPTNSYLLDFFLAFTKAQFYNPPHQMEIFVKRIWIVLCCVLAVGAAGCGKKKANASAGKNTGARVVAETLTASITPAEGWTQEGSARVPTYVHPTSGASLVLTTDAMPDEVKTPEAYATFMQGKFKEHFKEASFGPITKTKVAGMDAAEYTYTSRSFQWRIIYVCKGGKSYTITCCAMSQTFEKCRSDFQAMIDSYTLE